VCTLIALHQVHCEYPLVVAANRDELYARRTSAPQVLNQLPRVVGGRDEEKGGTWLGVSERGFFIGLTNQRSWMPPDPRKRSRGEVVLTALAQQDLAAAVAWLEQLDAADYNPFNLLLGDGERLFVAYARPEAARLEFVALAAGVWALPNDRLGSPHFPKADRAVELARPLTTLPWPELQARAQVLLADHELPPPEAIVEGAAPPWLPAELQRRLQALCVHTPSYGTRSASLLAIGNRRVERYLHAEGPPCQAPLIDYGACLRQR
jgi:uncharacterized protein with NRDE domain